MISRHRSNSGVFSAIVLSLFVALVLKALPVPKPVYFFWPDWIVLVVIYWALIEPERISAVAGLLIGLLLEVLFVRKFGVNGIGLATLIFLVNRMHLQLRVLSVWQQSLVVALLMLIYKFLTGWLYGLVSGFVISREYWYSVIGSILVWPFVFIILNQLSSNSDFD